MTENRDSPGVDQKTPSESGPTEIPPEYQQEEEVEEHETRWKRLLTGLFEDKMALFGVIVIVGFTGGLVALATFDDRYITADADNRTLALLIATGIGLNIFSEGLAIGQSAASGALSLATLLIIGFALHNITEGFGIAAPLTNETASVSFLGLLGLIAGGPVFVGTMIGRLWTSQIATVLFLALAGGALVYVIDELFRTATMGTTKTPVFVSVAVGFFSGLGTELVITIASA